MKDLKLLVIDPDFDYLQLISQFLSAEGFHVVTATDGEEGLRKAMIESPDLILLEPMLSKLHGFTLCNIVSKEFKKKVPVIILTNHYQDARFKKEAIQVYGAAAYLTRPITKKELRSAIFDVLGNKSMDGVEEIPVAKEPDFKHEIEQVTEEKAPSKAVREEPEEVKVEDPTEIHAEEKNDVIANSVKEPAEVVMEDKVELTADSSDEPTNSSGNNDNGSNGKSKVDKMLNDIESEFGLLTDKKLSNGNHDLQI
jgi:DNA-binding response OmpR family regulator